MRREATEQATNRCIYTYLFTHSNHQKKLCRLPITIDNSKYNEENHHTNLHMGLFFSESPNNPPSPTPVPQTTHVGRSGLRSWPVKTWLDFNTPTQAGTQNHAPKSVYLKIRYQFTPFPPPKKNYQIWGCLNFETTFGQIISINWHGNPQHISKLLRRTCVSL